MKKVTTYFRIKVKNQLKMKLASKLIYMSSANGYSIYRTMAYDDSEEVKAYLSKLGCDPEIVSKLSLQNIN
jgi:hypothetical protein